MERELSKIGAKVANATALLIEVQREIEELYISMEDVEEQGEADEGQ